ncbi:hypothetical protein HDE_05077 [Halotydeus destructor]|nr:hypothetical protein HDE_05077 [Halotydeus destructor]
MLTMSKQQRERSELEAEMQATSIRGTCSVALTSSSGLCGVKKKYHPLCQSEPEALKVEQFAPEPSPVCSVLPLNTSCVSEQVAESSSASSSTGDDDEDDEEEEEEDEEGEDEDGGDDNDSDYEYDDYVACNVCDRTFSTIRQLTVHQTNKMHFGCSVCEGLFPTLIDLKEHKESLEHWSDGEPPVAKEDNDSDESDNEHTNQEQELERLL